jgi:hypothetical protein
VPETEDGRKATSLVNTTVFAKPTMRIDLCHAMIDEALLFSHGPINNHSWTAGRGRMHPPLPIREVFISQYALYLL